MEERPLKIVYLITKANFGGAQRYVYDLATRARESGHEVVVGFGGGGTLKDRLIERGVRTISIDALSRDIHLFHDVQSFFALLALLHRERPNVVHINSSKMGGMGSLAGRIWNGYARSAYLLRLAPLQPTRIIFTGHGWAFNEDRNDLERLVIGVVHWATIHLAHTTIAVSRRTRNQVMMLPFVGHKLQVIHNGVGTQDLLSKGDAERELGVPTDSETLHVGTLAELHKNKGLMYALEGIALIKKQRPNQKIMFTIIGEGEERLSLESQILALGIGDSVTLAGYRENAARLLTAFDVFLLPSITEAFPYAILEAGRAGLPVVATSVGGIPEVIDDMESGILIQSKNGSEVARALLYLIDNPKRRIGLGEALRARIKNRFSLLQMVNATFALYGNAD